MILPEYEVYAVSSIGNNSFQGFLKNNGRKIILKKAEKFIDTKVLDFLAKVKMQGIPYIIGKTVWQSKEWLIFNWQEGEAIYTKRSSAAVILKIVDDILSLINKLNLISGYNWFFLDFKMEHILIDELGNISLIDFEHVFLSKQTQINWHELKKIGLSTAYCSPEIKQESLSKNHHEYALGLIMIALLSQHDIQNLTHKIRRKTIKQFPEAWQIKLENALLGKGFKPEKSEKNQIIPPNPSITKTINQDNAQIDIPNQLASELKVVETTENSKTTNKNNDDLSLSEPFLLQHKISLGDGRTLNLQINLIID